MTPPKVDNNNYNPNARGVSLGKYNPQNGYKGTLDQIDKLFDGKKIQGIRIGNYLICRDKEDGQLKVMENGKPSSKSAQDVLIGRYSRNGENTNVNCKAARARITQLLESPDDISGETLDFEPTSSGSTRTADSELKTESEAKFKKAVEDYKNKPTPENLQTAKDAYNYYLAVSGDDDFNNRPYKELARLNALEALSGAKTPEDLAFVLKTHRGTIESDPELADVKNQKLEESINYLKNLDPSSHDGVTPYVLADWVGTSISSNAARSIIISGQIKHDGAVNVLADHVTDAKDKEAVAKAIVDGKINDPTKVFVLARFLNQGQIKEVISKGKVTDLETLRALARMLPAEDARQGMIAGGKRMMDAQPGTYLSNVNFALADGIYQKYPPSAGNQLLVVNEGRKTYAFVIAPADGGKYKVVLGEAPKGFLENYKPTGSTPGAKTAPAIVPPLPQPAPDKNVAATSSMYGYQHDLPAARPPITEQKTLQFNGVRVDLPSDTEVEGSGYIATYKIKSDKTITLEAFDRTSRQWGNKQVELHSGDKLSQNGDTITVERQNGQKEFYYAVPPEVRGDSPAPGKAAPATSTPGANPPAAPTPPAKNNDSGLIARDVTPPSKPAENKPVSAAPPAPPVVKSGQKTASAIPIGAGYKPIPKGTILTYNESTGLHAGGRPLVYFEDTMQGDSLKNQGIPSGSKIVVLPTGQILFAVVEGKTVSLANENVKVPSDMQTRYYAPKPESKTGTTAVATNKAHEAKPAAVAQNKPAPSQPAAKPAKPATLPSRASTTASEKYSYDKDRDRLQEGSKELTDISKQSDDYQKDAIEDFHFVVGRTIQGAYRAYVSREIGRTEGNTPLKDIKGKMTVSYKVQPDGKAAIISAKIGETNATSHFKSATSGLKFPLPRVKQSLRSEIFEEQSIGSGVKVQVKESEPGGGTGRADIGNVEVH